MKVAITGACGYMGSVLVPKLIGKGNTVDLLDIQPPVEEIADKVDGKLTRFIQMDVSDYSRMSRLAKEYDYVIHLAALVGYPSCQKFPKLAVRRNVLTTKSITTHCRKDARIILASTVSNYGPQNNIATEETPIHPPSIYGRTKMRAEELVMEHGKNVVYRIAGAFGWSPKMRHDNIIHDFVSQAVAGKTLSIYESIFIRQFIHTQDITDAMVFAMNHWDRVKGNIFNLGNPKIEITKGDLVKKIVQYHPETKYMFENSGHDPEKRNYKISFKKLVDAGFKPKFSLDEGLQELVGHYLIAPRANVSSLGIDTKTEMAA